ncbi:MAG TPA: CPBP family intramembrane glutamic endopeptidase [Vicinamibacteria bacterium]|nr:CPBP family intramembrane glutamic endopeptidase [Vicinamibacteria bacterium]
MAEAQPDPAAGPRFALAALAVSAIALTISTATPTLGPYRELYGRAPHWAGMGVKAAQALLCVLGLVLAHRVGLRGALRELGLAAPVLAGLMVGLGVSLPMLIGLGLTYEPSRHLAAERLLKAAVVSPFAEEVLFRGYLFRQLYRRAGWSLAAATAVSALAFGLSHAPVVAAGPGVVVAAELLVTTAGGALFAWLFARWGDNLWVPIGLHGGMNLWWDVFAVDNTAIGGLPANAVRGLTVVFAVVVAVLFPRRLAEALRRRAAVPAALAPVGGLALAALYSSVWPHELGHSVVAHIVGCKPDLWRTATTWFLWGSTGGETNYACLGERGRGALLATNFAGIGVNLVLVAVAAAVGRGWRRARPRSGLWLAVATLLWALANYAEAFSYLVLNTLWLKSDMEVVVTASGISRWLWLAAGTAGAVLVGLPLRSGARTVAEALASPGMSAASWRRVFAAYAALVAGAMAFARIALT